MKTSMHSTTPYLAAVLALGSIAAFTRLGQAADLTPAEARAIAKEAAVYGCPMIDSYRWPKEAALDGSWKAPELKMVK